MLFFLVWFSEVIVTLKLMFASALSGLLGVLLIWIVIAVVWSTERIGNPAMVNLKAQYKKIVGLILTFSVLTAITPSQKTYYAMLGVYAGQEIIANPKAQALLDKSIKAIEVQLDIVINKNQEK